MSQKRAKITVLLDREEFERFDAYCEQEGFKKSTLIARLIRNYLNETQFNLPPPASLYKNPDEGR